jgi:hypothetical protein
MRVGSCWRHSLLADALMVYESDVNSLWVGEGLFGDYPQRHSDKTAITRFVSFVMTYRGRKRNKIR